MFSLDSLGLNGYIDRTSPYEIYDEFEVNESDRQFQWAAGPRGAALVSEPDLPNVEITLPIRINPRFTSAHTNLLTNPRPASVVTGWTGTAVTFNTVDGESVIQSVTAGTLHDGIQTSFTGTVAAYSAGVWVKVATGTAPIEVQFDGQTATAITATTSWQFVKTENKTLSAATRYLLVRQADTGTRTIYVKMAGVVQSATYPGYFDGSCGDAIWNGTPHASTSTCLTGQEAVDLAYGVLREKLDKVIAAAGLGGTDLTWKPKRATWNTTLKCLAGAMQGRKYDHKHKDISVADFTLTLFVGPYFMGPEYTLASGSKATGLPAIEVLAAAAKGDAPGPAEVLLDEPSAIQRWAMLGIEHRNYRASTALTIKASDLTLGYSGALTAAANEVQLCTRAGTISGGPFTLTFEGKMTTAIGYNANAATIQAALEALPNVGTGDWVVTGGPVSTTNVTFTAAAALAGRNLSQISITSSLTGGGTVTMSTTTPGTAGYVRSTLFSEWTTLAQITGQTHVGTYRVVAVVRDNAAAADLYKSCIRLRWGVGDLSSTVTGASVTPRGIGDVTHVSLGTVIIPEVETGTQNWGGFIEVKTNSATAALTLDVQDILLFPVELSFASAATPAASGAGTVAMFENFGATAGPLTGDTATSGQTWATMGGHTDADDFTQTAAPANTVIRTAVSDSSASSISYGRGVLLGAATPTDVQVAVGLSVSTGNGGWKLGVIARFVDNDNFVAAVVSVFTNIAYVEICKVRLGAMSVPFAVGPFTFLPGSVYTLVFRAFASGVWDMSFEGNCVGSGHDADLATGGALASGKSGIIDWHAPAAACTRTFTNFTVIIPPAESAVQHPGRGLIFGEGITRENSSGGMWGPAPNQVQARPIMIGPAGPDGLSNRLLIATAEQNPDLANTGAPDRFDWEIRHTPCYSFARYAQ